MTTFILFVIYLAGIVVFMADEDGWPLHQRLLLSLVWPAVMVVAACVELYDLVDRKW